MDINFHYYAVKAMADRAGFPDGEAQTIASYSQFVDDFDETGSIVLDNIPAWAMHLAIPAPGGNYYFCIVTTGFNSWFDMARLYLEENQKWILMPFHFITRAPKNTLPDRILWRVSPARMDTDSLIRDLLVDARTRLTTQPANRPQNLIRIGLLLHIFADTYAHRYFSGSHGWENHSYLTNVTNNITGGNVTGSYWPRYYYRMPSIGHTNVGHAPDDSNVRFTMHQRLNEDDDYSASLFKNNTEDYCGCAKEILNFLRSCRGMGEISPVEWNPIEINLAHGFLTEAKDVPSLNNHWLVPFFDVNFNYDPAPLRNATEAIRELAGEEKAFAEAFGVPPFVYATKSEAWYHYNVIAHEIREAANGVPHHSPYNEALRKALSREIPMELNDEGENKND